LYGQAVGHDRLVQGTPGGGLVLERQLSDSLDFGVNFRLCELREVVSTVGLKQRPEEQSARRPVRAPSAAGAEVYRRIRVMVERVESVAWHQPRCGLEACCFQAFHDEFHGDR